MNRQKSPLISRALLADFYRKMLRIRMVEEKIAALYPEQEMRCPVHLSIGQEAAAVGACAALTDKDFAMSGHRSHGHYLARGGDLKAMLAELYGRATGCCMGKGGSMHMIDIPAGFLGATPIVGSTVAIAVGAAFGAVMKHQKRVIIAFLGDAAVEEGVFHEAINFASLKKLPVVFVCENNLYSVYSPLSVRQPAGTKIIDLAKSHGVEAFQGDGNNVVDVFQMTNAAVRKARGGGGPTFLEFFTYRWREHCGHAYDDHLGYRSEKEVAQWKRRDPVGTFEKLLLKKRVLIPAHVAATTQEINAEIDEAVRFAKASPFPEKGMLMQHIYAPSRDFTAVEPPYVIPARMAEAR